MICSRKTRFVISLLLICISAPLWSAEPSEAKIDLKFETDNNKSQLWVSDRQNTPGKGPIKPTHVAVLNLRNLSLPFITNNHESILQILNTPSGKTLSEQQRKFLTVSDAVFLMDHRRSSSNMVFLYAVSAEDAKRMARAYLEVPIEINKERKREYERKIEEETTQISKIEKELPEKKKQVEEAESKYRQAKKTRYFPLDDDEANDRAKEAMLQMDKMLDVLEIELAGILEKLEAIKEYRRPGKPVIGISADMIHKLDQMLIEQTIELKSAEARKQTALKIRSRHKAFLDLFKQWEDLDLEAKGLTKTLQLAFVRKREYERDLLTKKPMKRLPVVHEKKATIYPVLTQ